MDPERKLLMKPKTYGQGLRFALDVFERRADVINLPVGSMVRRMYDDIAVELATFTAESSRDIDYMNALAHKGPEMEGGAGD